MSSLDKRIITHKWGNNPTNDEYTSSNGFIFSSRYDQSFAHYAKLVAIAKKDFPHLTDNDIECEVVQKSSYMLGFPYVRFRLPQNAECQGYRQSTRADWS